MKTLWVTGCVICGAEGLSLSAPAGSRKIKSCSAASQKAPGLTAERSGRVTALAEFSHALLSSAARSHCFYFFPGAGSAGLKTPPLRSMRTTQRGLSTLFLALFILVSVFAAAGLSTALLARGANTSGRGKLTGQVRRGPACPRGQNCPSEPATGVALRILTPAGQEVKSALTDTRGVYTISLLPGTYRIEMAPLASSGRSKDLPATVTIVEGKQKRMDIFIETGNRKAQSVRGMGLLLGRVTAGPMSPVGGIGVVREPAPVPDAKLVISRLHGEQIKSVVTDDRGAYRVDLPAGSYRIEMVPLPRRCGRGAENLPATVTITEGKETRLDILVDTGIR